MGRPPGYQWEPLGLDSDPVPGDPGRISEEAAHLASVAKQISQQVARLHKLAAGGAGSIRLREWVCFAMLLCLCLWTGHLPMR